MRIVWCWNFSSRCKKDVHPLATWDKDGKDRSVGAVVKKERHKEEEEEEEEAVVEGSYGRVGQKKKEERTRHDLNAGQGAGGRWYRIYQVSGCNRSCFVFNILDRTAGILPRQRVPSRFERGFPFNIRRETSIRFDLTSMTSASSTQRSQFTKPSIIKASIHASLLFLSLIPISLPILSHFTENQ